MSLLFDSTPVNIAAILIALGIGVITYFKWAFTYWKRKDLPFVQPAIPFGTMENPIAPKMDLGFLIKKNYDELKALGHKHGGLFNFSSPVYLPIDPEYIKNVMQRDFQHFVDRGMFYNEKDDPLSAHLFFMGGSKWRNMRAKLTPTFTSGKIKMMFDMLLQCSNPLKGAMDELASKNQAVDIKEMVARFTTDVIGTCAFGLDCNSFKDSDSEFRRYGKKIFEFGKLQFLGMMLFLAFPNLGRKLRIKLSPQDTTNFFLGAIRDTVSYRESNNITRNDMLQLMMELKNNPKDGAPLTIEEIATQAYSFFIGGFETSSSTMTFCLYELSQNPKIQEKVHREIQDVLKKHDNKINYEAIEAMKYLGQVIDETLRKHPNLPQITRECVLDYRVPGTDIVIEKGTSVFIPALGLHRDPEFYPDPEKFDPERFSEENKKKRVPFTYIPFGEGPRICIGQRFGLLQTKVGLAILLKDFKFSLNKNTEVPFRLDARNVIYASESTIWLNAEKIEWTPKWNVNDYICI